MGMENFDYGKISTIKNFVGYVMLVHGEFLWLWFWLCENLFVHKHEFVGIF